MAHCVISAIVDTDHGDTLVAACMVHTAHAPCMHDGEPASPVPLHAYGEILGPGGREGALQAWRIRTHRQRPLIIHNADPVRTIEDHVTGTEIHPCWCGAEILAAEGPAMPEAAQPHPDEVTERLMHLRAMLADLQGFIEREAHELAEPIIRDAEARAQLAVVEARGEMQIEKDVNQELRRRIRAADKYHDDVKRYRDRLAAALGRHPSTPWPSLAAEIETRLKESTDA